MAVCSNRGVSASNAMGPPRHWRILPTNRLLALEINDGGLLGFRFEPLTSAYLPSGRDEDIVTLPSTEDDMRSLSEVVSITVYDSRPPSRMPNTPVSIFSNGNVWGGR